VVIFRLLLETVSEPVTLAFHEMDRAPVHQMIKYGCHRL